MMIDAPASSPRATTPAALRSVAPVTTPSHDAIEAGAGSAAEAVRAVAERIRNYLRESGRELQFRVDADTGRMVVTVRDPTTGETIRQIPAEEVLHIARNLQSPIERLAELRA